MKLEQRIWTEEEGWKGGLDRGSVADLVLVFGGTDALRDKERLQALRESYPGAHFIGCSTAGEIAGTTVLDDSIVATAIKLERSEVRGASEKIADGKDSFRVGQALATTLDAPDLIHMFVISNGLKVNGSELVRGITQALPAEVTVTGGLSGDGARFQETLVLWDSEPSADAVAAVGFYGDALRIGYGSQGGWDPFGPQRLVTRSRGNVLYELDNQPALELYKRYLGSHADELPASGLLFPLSITVDEEHQPVVRTILAVDEADGSMTFAGDVPEGAVGRLMKANFDRLIDGAAGAARTSGEALRGSQPDLAVLISCVGRKLVLKQRVEEEVEAVSDLLGDGTLLTGFYSYGEISPFVPEARCELHNQTMTITTFSER